MTAVAILFLVALVAFVSALAFRDDHTFSGYAAGVTFLLLVVSGTVLAVNQL